LQLVVAMAKALVTLCGVMILGQQPLPLLDTFVEFATQLHRLGFFLSTTQHDDIAVQAQEMMHSATSMLRMLCPPSPMAPTATILTRIAFEGSENIRALVPALHLASC